MGIYSIKKPKINKVQIEDFIFLQEATSERKWKCPYCNLHDTKERLIQHVDDEHSDMLSNEYPAARAVFNFINKKDHGTCIICGKETEWNNDTCRYERLCKMKKCKEEYVRRFKTRMINVHGTECLLNDPEQQKLMLSHRSISGEYKFQDGGIRSYVGSYEKKLLEFFDLVLHTKSIDIITPGPIIEYEYKGETLKWITDVFYVPANLVFDVKDGGKNPNNRPMPDFRAKQNSKENAIKKLGTYNYIRLTDNNFQQLLLILAQIKYQLLDPDKSNNDPIININEDATTIGALPPQNNGGNNAYVVPYLMNNVFALGFTTDKYFSNFYKVNDDCRVCKSSIKELEECDKYSLYEYKGNIDIKSLLTESEVDKYYFYTALTGKKMLSEDQIEFDESFELVNDYYIDNVLKAQVNEATIQHQLNQADKSIFYFPIVNEREKNKILEFNHEFKFENIEFLKDMDGYFAMNESSNKRTKSEDKLDALFYAQLLSKLY